MVSLFRLGDHAPTLPSSGDAWVAPTATLIGQVRLGSEASIWFGAILRADNDLIEIGARSNVQDGAVLHSDVGVPTVIGEGVTVGHMAMVHSCVIGDNSLIGIGAIILAGARIGRNCLIGAGALVTGNADIPDGSLVIGRPGKVSRRLSDAEIRGLAESAASYVRNGRRFAAQLGAA
jgi:carbonic anhydrase/acetyltransferase-like protein (isoleucine patch superfamily)